MLTSKNNTENIEKLCTFADTLLEDFANNGIN